MFIPGHFLACERQGSIFLAARLG